MSIADFRPYVPAPGESKIAGDTARSHAQAIVRKDLIIGIFDYWKGLFTQPFKGITTNNLPPPGLFSLRSENAPTEGAVKASIYLLDQLSVEQRAGACFNVGSDQWRNWQNTEIYVESHGLRLEELERHLREAVLEVIRASLSERGYEKTRKVMRLNRFLGELVGGPGVMGEWSYIFCLFGLPSIKQPWGWQLFGHHLALNCLFIDQQMVLTPTFMGAEPAYADEDPFMDLRAFQDEERIGLEFMRSLSPEQRTKALIANSMVGGDLPSGRRQVGDGLHLGGAYQDNRIIPYEGVKGAAFTLQQKKDLLDLTQQYLCTLPPGPLETRMSDVERYLDETHFCWIGSCNASEPFYYRIQSPIVLVEFDHHAGVYLTNTEPANFHVHTLVRTPNGNDYGIDLIRQHYNESPHHRGNNQQHLTGRSEG